MRWMINWARIELPSVVFASRPDKNLVPNLQPRGGVFERCCACSPTREKPEAQKAVPLEPPVQGHQPAAASAEGFLFSAFWPFDGEPDITPLFEPQMEDGVALVLPVVSNGDGWFTFDQTL